MRCGTIILSSVINVSTKLLPKWPGTTRNTTVKRLSTGRSNRCRFPHSDRGAKPFVGKRCDGMGVLAWGTAGMAQPTRRYFATLTALVLPSGQGYWQLTGICSWQRAYNFRQSALFESRMARMVRLCSPQVYEFHECFPRTFTRAHVHWRVVPIKESICQGCKNYKNVIRVFVPFVSFVIQT